jgi:hypothetical protein
MPCGRPHLSHLTNAIVGLPLQRNSRRSSVGLHRLTPMLHTMLIQCDPCLYQNDTMLLASLVSPIKVSSEQVLESGHSDSKAIYAGTVFLGQLFAFGADRCFRSSHAYASAREGLNTHRRIFNELVPVPRVQENQSRTASNRSVTACECSESEHRRLPFDGVGEYSWCAPDLVVARR